MTARFATAVLLIAGIVAGCGTGKAWPSPVAPTPSPTATPSPTPSPTPEITPSPTPTAEPTPDVSPAPDGYQLIVSAESGYAIAIPSTWVFVSEDSPVSVADQIANLEAQYPAMATLFSGETAMLGQAYRVVIFDPTRFSSGHLMVGMLGLTAAQTATDLTTAASALKSELNSIYKLSGLTSATLQLPAGPTIKITASMSVSGTSMKLVEYAVFASAHTFIVLLMSTSGDWAGYSKTFDTIPTTLQEI